jgi:hypothetical protein
VNGAGVVEFSDEVFDFTVSGADRNGAGGDVAGEAFLPGQNRPCVPLSKKDGFEIHTNSVH